VAESNKSRAIDAQLFTWPDPNPALLGSRCNACGFHAFPPAASCTLCGAVDPEIVQLPRRGTLWAWTIQRFMPKEPYRSFETRETFRQYGVGYIELPGALRVESRLTENDPAKLRIGQEMELALYVHRIEADGTEVMNYAFKPVGVETRK